MNKSYPEVPTPDTAAYYDGLAEWGYDELATEMGWPTKASTLIKRVFELEQPKPNGDVLDLGAGSGFTIDAIRRYSQPNRIDAVDISKGMLDLLIEYRDGANIVPTVAPMQDYVTYTERTHDLITSMGAMEFVPELPRFLTNVPRLLNERGIFAATYMPLPEDGKREHVQDSPDLGESLKSYFWKPAEVEQSLIGNGLTIVDKVDAIAAYELGEETVLYNFVVAAKSV